MLSKDKIRELRAQGNSLPSMVQVGKEEPSEGFFELLNNELEAHELVKISLLKTSSLDPKELAESLADRMHAEVIQVIGRTILLYRKSRKEKR